MIKTPIFKPSRSLYAVDLGTLSRCEVGKVESTGQPLYRYEITAVWFKRRNGLDTANIGALWDISTDLYEETNPLEAVTFLSYALTDGRFGGDCRSRWDGSHLWSKPDTPLRGGMTKDLRFLRQMLINYPQIPPGYDGWWTFNP